MVPLIVTMATERGHPTMPKAQRRRGGFALKAKTTFHPLHREREDIPFAAFSLLPPAPTAPWVRWVLIFRERVLAIGIPMLILLLAVQAMEHWRDQLRCT
jgi:hypothetical protein